MTNEYIFEKTNYNNDNEWIIMDFFNSLNLQNKFIYGIDSIIKKHGFVINETYCQFPDLQELDTDFHFEGIMFGVWEGEVIVPEKTALKHIRLACERYVKIHPEDADKVKFLLDKISN
ncbi:ribonuclease toxin immunity protein CdiI [Pectobacterium carotovorum]